MAKMGRPPKKIDLDSLDKLCRLQCTEEEIAGFFEVSISTLYKRVKDNTVSEEHPDGMTFQEYRDIKAQQGKIKLRRAQFRLAEKNARMAIFLGKQVLKQRDIQDIRSNVTLGTYDVELTDKEKERYYRNIQDAFPGLMDGVYYTKDDKEEDA